MGNAGAGGNLPGRIRPASTTGYHTPSERPMISFMISVVPP